MANFSFTLDTQEMASSIDGVSSRVNAVTAAVVAMQTAVVSAETAAANRVCKNVDRGFFSLIRSQITQKIARLRSEVDSRFIEMRQQSQTLAGIKTRMERDYVMIANRYTRVFHSIDLSLRGRVFELDKAVSSFVNREIERMKIRLHSLQAQVPMHQSESVQTTQVIAASQAKENAQRALRAMQNFLSDSTRQARLLDSMLFQGSPQSSAVRYVPFLLMESESTSAGGTRWDFRTPRGGGKNIEKKVNAGVESVVFASLPSLKWTAPNADTRNRSGGEFRRMAGQANLNGRIQTHMTRLFDSSAWQVMTGERT